MGLSGGSSEASIEHDVVESWRHEIDKRALGQRKKGDWILVPRLLEHEFLNDFSSIKKTEALYFRGAEIHTSEVEVLEPEPWDESGTIASFSAGSGAAELRDFFRSQNRRARGRKATGDVPKRELPKPPPGKPMATPILEQTGPLEHLKWLRGIRDASDVYHRWGTGAGRRLQWKPTPASTRTKSIEGDAGPGDLDATIDRVEGDPSAVSESAERKKRVVRQDADLRRYTVNSHPALARALAKMVAAGEKDQVIAVMAELAPGVAAKFQEITGRKCVALSVHFDSAMPHWNIWHSGLEKVSYPVGQNKRVRYRRTAFDLNSSGNLLAWHRTRLAFERLGKDFRALSSRTVEELEKGLKRAMDRQDRPPGDWTINEEADLLLEAALRGRGKAAEVEAGFKEFVENEEKRYRDGVAGRGPKEARKLSVLLRDHESADEAIERLKRADEIEEIEKNLRPREGESLTDCSARVVERTQELAEELSSSAHDASVLRTERDELKVQIGKSEKVIAQVSSVLEPRPGESLAAAARRLAARAMEAISLKAKAKKWQTEGEKLCVENAALTRQVGELEKQLGSEQEKVRRLEEEITPLRVLRDHVKELLKELKASPLAQKFEVGLKSLLSEIGKLVGINFAPGKEEPAPEVDQSS